MNKIIQVSKEISPNAKILLVDVEADYLEGTDYESNPEVMEEVDKRIERMAVTAKNLVAKGHDVQIIVDIENHAVPFEPLRGLPILPPWGIPNLPVLADEIDPAKIYHLDPTIAAVYNKDDLILVAGLWREQCVLSVVRILSYHGYNAILSLNDDISLQASIAYLDDINVTVECNCTKANLTVELYKGEG